MSLQLRKNCQQLLDDVGLANYHVQVNTNTKCLEVVGECGESLVQIHGIRLSRINPSNSEINLAVELFDAFLAKHASAFHEFIKSKAKADAATIPMEVKGLQNAEVKKENYTNEYILTFSLKDAPEREVKVSNAGFITFKAYKTSFYEVSDSVFKASINQKEIDIVSKWVEACREYAEAVKSKKAILEKLSSCEI